MKPKIAIVDLLFEHPPKGGSGVDLVETFRRLSPFYELRLFFPRVSAPFPRGTIADRSALPFQTCPVEIENLSRVNAVASFSNAINRWRPHSIFMADGWTLKPFLCDALASRFPTILRLYAYEALCPRNNERWLHDQPCDNFAIVDCGRCLRCAKEYASIIENAKGLVGNILTHEAQNARIWDGDYEKTLRKALRKCEIVVYNSWLSKVLRKHLNAEAHVVPGGVDTSVFKCSTKKRNDHSQFTILVFGRMDDPAKGAIVAIEATKRLREDGGNVKLVVTRRPANDAPDWLEETGWLNRNKLVERLADADLVVMPSLWQEAFGMTWVEAMAMGKPVVASAVAGPLDWIVDGENGLLFKPGNVEELAVQIRRLMDDEDLRSRITENGFQMVKDHLTWDHAAAKTRTVIQKVLNLNP